ncbi:MAG: starch-binding protein [bacterium]|nr:starch-binding protein [bacterium]
MYKLLWSMLALLLGASSASAGSAWPANYDGVMLQGFYWDSYKETSWASLEAQSDELSKYFQLIWIPNSARAASNPGMGYDPVYWFSNYNSSFGTEAELRSMIKAFKAKGTGMIADVVINHRSGATNWCDFPSETWNGVTYHIGLDGICRTDEASRNGYNVTGNADEGEDFDGSRDLDHTNANVQANCKAYTKFLLEELGYTGFRYDMVKGYAGYYTGQYNAASGTQFSVGEYWDGNYDAVAKWIDQTSEKGGGKSAAFDFPCKYAINEAFASNDMTKLVWKANGTTDQPAGMIHFGYPQYAVTFVDNHDTYRDGSKFTGNVMAANAFILCSPGTPCVFWPHYTANKTAMQALINARRNAGITNTSAVKVLKSTSNCYMAEITGTKGKLAVKIGSAMESPSGYTNSQIVASGTDYCVWSTSTGGYTPDPVIPDDPVVGGDTPAALYLVGNIEDHSWEPTAAGTIAMTKDGDKFTAKGVSLKYGTSADAYFSFITALGSATATDPWAAVNASVRYGATSKDAALSGSATIETFVAGTGDAYSWKVPVGVYDITADFSTMKVTVTKTGEVVIDPDPVDPTPSGDAITIYYDDTTSGFGNVNIHYWSKPNTSWPGVAMTKVSGNIWKYTFPADATISGFLFCNSTGSAQTGDYQKAPVNGHLYKGASNKGAVTDQGEYSGGNNPDPVDPTPTPSGDVPEALYLLGNFGGDFSPYMGDNVSMTKSGSKFTATGVELKIGTSTDAYFGFATSLAPATATVIADAWDKYVNATDRYGAATADAAINGSAPMVKYAAGTDASSAASWKVPVGIYTIEADFATMTVKATKTGDVVIETPDPIDPDPVDPTPTTGRIMHFKGTSEWTKAPNAYVYNEKVSPKVEPFGAWSGKTMTAEGDGWYKIELPATVTADYQVIFNTAGGSPRYPADMDPGIFISFTGSEGWYLLSDKKWYDKKPDGGDNPDPVVGGDAPEALYLLGNFGGNFSPYEGDNVTMTKSGSKFTATGVELKIGTSTDAYFGFATSVAPKSVTVIADAWDLYVNATDRYGAATADAAIDGSAPMVKYAAGTDASSAASWKVPVGIYTIEADFATMTVKATKTGDVVITPDPIDPDPIDPDPVVDMPEALYLLGNFGGDFSPYEGDNVTMTKSGSKFTATGVELKIGTSTDAYFGFATSVAPKSVTVIADAWDLYVNATDRYGAATADAAIDGSAPMVKYAAGTDASSAASWKVPVGIYTIEADFATMTVKATKTGEVVIETPDPIDPDPIDPDPVVETITVHFHSSWAGQHYAYVYTPAGKVASNLRAAAGEQRHSAAWPGDEMTAEGNGWHSYVLPATADKSALIVFNNGEDQHPGMDEDGLGLTFNGNEGWYRHADQMWYDTKPEDVTTVPDALYLIGNTGGDFSPYLSGMIEMTKNGDIFTAKDVYLYIGTSKDAYFAFATASAPEEATVADAWDEYVNASVRYGAASKDETLVNNMATMVAYAPGAEAANAFSWKVPTGIYDIEADFGTMTVTATLTSAAINGINAEADAAGVRYFNLQGVEVANPTSGVYIVVSGGKATKQLIK